MIENNNKLENKTYPGINNMTEDVIKKLFINKNKTYEQLTSFPSNKKSTFYYKIRPSSIWKRK
jgi:hypothetical protein